MYIVIVGAGEVGSYLARILAEEQHDVAVVELDEGLARSLEGSIDALVIHGSGVSHSALAQAGIARADLVLAVTEVDEVNLITCMAASHLGSRSLRTVARVRDHAYLAGEDHFSAMDLGLDLLVGPERATATEIVSQLTYHGTGEIHHLADGKLALLELPLSADSPLVHESIAELREVLPQPSLIAAIRGVEGFRIPRGDDRMSTDDRVYILTTPEVVGEWWILSGKPWHHVKHVHIIGCGTIGLHLARELEARKMFPSIVEINRARAERVARKLTKSLVRCGDGTDPELLTELLEERKDAVCVLIDDDEKAVLVGLFAKHLGAKKVIVRSDTVAYAPIAHKLGVDALISPRRAVADEILRFVRRGRVAAAHMLGDHEGEIIDLKVPHRPTNTDLLEKPLRELDFPAGALLGAVITPEGVRIADGGTRLAGGDDALVIALPQAIQAVEKLFT